MTSSSPDQSELFPQPEPLRPLADRMRPRTLDEVVGQGHLFGKDSPLRHAFEQDRLHSMVFWGPPGTGKTTLARLLAKTSDSAFASLSAVLSGVKDIRAAVADAKARQVHSAQRTVLFVDEVHRFNKAQQDAFLPHIEDGTVYFVGATTENPGFELNNALLSRVRVHVLRSLTVDAIVDLLDRALLDRERGLGELSVRIDDDVKIALAAAADGDARRALMLLELAADCAPREGELRVIDKSVLVELNRDSVRRFDKGGDAFYDQISALHKSVRGSDPDAALYWLARMLDGGCDPRYIARRVLRMASEDIGNADLRALSVAMDAWQVYERLGSPEGELALAQAVVYLACTSKSNAVYSAFKSAQQAVREYGSLEVPTELRNAPTELMQSLGHGEGYRYAHDEPDGFAAGARYLPEGMPEQRFYAPVERGLELRIAERLSELRRRNRESQKQE